MVQESPRRPFQDAASMTSLPRAWFTFTFEGAFKARPKKFGHGFHLSRTQPFSPSTPTCTSSVVMGAQSRRSAIENRNRRRTRRREDFFGLAATAPRAASRPDPRRRAGLSASSVR